MTYLSNPARFPSPNPSLVHCTAPARCDTAHGSVTEEPTLADVADGRTENS